MSNEGFDGFIASLPPRVSYDLRTAAGFDALLTGLQKVDDSVVPSASHARSIIRGGGNQWNPSRVSTLLLLEHEGRLSLEHDDEYVLAVMQVTCGPLRDHLVLNDGPFRQRAVWRLFEVPGGGEVSLANFDKYYEKSGGWGTSFVSYATSGALPRDRVLHCCLEALSRGFGSYVSGWFSTLYRSIEPTVEEIATHEKVLRTLLSSTVGATVTLAVGALAELADRDRLDRGAFLAAVVDVSTMTTANTRAVLRIAEQSDQAEHIDAVTRLVGQAVAHRDRVVQRVATGWLVAHDRSDLIERAGAMLSPTVAVGSGVSLAEAMPDPAAEARSFAPYVAVPDSELVEHFAVLLEDSRDPLAVEAGLAALASSPNPRQLAPLAKRARRPTEGNGWEALSVRRLVASLVVAASGEHLPVDRQRASLPPLLYPRFAELRTWVLNGHPSHELLATPDDTTGSIAADSLHRRLSRALDQGRPIWHADFTAALLRVKPDGLARPALAGEAGAALHYALGGDAGKVRTAAWWVAAARSRHPFEHDAVLDKARLRLDGQAAPVAAELAVETYRWSHDQASGVAAKFALVPSDSEGRVRRRGERKWIEDQPTVLGLGLVKFGTEMPEDVARFTGLTWPHSTEFLAGFALANVAADVVSDSVSYGATGAFSALMNSPAPLGPLGRSLLVLGLSAKNVGDRAVAAETLAAAIGDRTTTLELAGSMALLAPAVKVTRWPAALVDTASISGHARACVVTLLTELLPLLDRALHGLGGLVELLEDELVRDGARATNPELRDWLEGFTGSGKSAKSARGILALRLNEENHA